MGYIREIDELLFQNVKLDNVSKVKSLIEQGANVNADDPDEYRRTANYSDYTVGPMTTPLFHAKSAEMARLLIEKGANVRHDVYGTAIFYVESVEVAKVLIENGLDVFERNSRNSTTLHMAGSVEMAKFLIESGVNVNIKNTMGETPLHTAMNSDIALVLIKNGADLNAKNRKGQTPLDTKKDIIEEAIKKLEKEQTLAACVILTNNQNVKEETNKILYAVKKGTCSLTDIVKGCKNELFTEVVQKALCQSHAVLCGEKIDTLNENSTNEEITKIEKELEKATNEFEQAMVTKTAEVKEEAAKKERISRIANLRNKYCGPDLGREA